MKNLEKIGFIEKIDFRLIELISKSWNTSHNESFDYILTTMYAGFFG